MSQGFVEKFKALSDEFRFDIFINLLNQGKPRCVGELVQDLSATQTRVSRNINIMKNAGLLISKRKGVNVFYNLNLNDEMSYKIASCIASEFKIPFSSEFLFSGLRDTSNFQ